MFSGDLALLQGLCLEREHRSSAASFVSILEATAFVTSFPMVYMRRGKATEDNCVWQFTGPCHHAIPKPCKQARKVHRWINQKLESRETSLGLKQRKTSPTRLNRTTLLALPSLSLNASLTVCLSYFTRHWATLWPPYTDPLLSLFVSPYRVRTPRALKLIARE